MWTIPLQFLTHQKIKNIAVFGSFVSSKDNSKTDRGLKCTKFETEFIVNAELSHMIKKIMTKMIQVASYSK